MDTQYLIRKIETCPACKGAKWFVNEDWQELNMAFDTWMKEHGWVCMNEEAYKEWDRRKEKAFPFGEPPEEEPCGECEGEGKIESWITLQEAMHELAERGTADDSGPVTSQVTYDPKELLRLLGLERNQ